jgi:hypothetical protein
MEQNLIQHFGFSEMYEWSNPDDRKFGLFVTFDKNRPDKVIPYNTVNGGDIIGITTVNSTIDSDDPEQWSFAYLCNEVGDLYLEKERLEVGQQVYDQVLEFNYIRTYPWEHYIPIENKDYNKELNYVKRSNRQEWTRVNLLGKVVVRDNGECVPGQYCQPYTGKLIELFGTAVPATDDCNLKKYYVIRRLSDHSVLILNK